MLTAAWVPESVGITTSVHCVAGVVDYVVKIIERDLLPNYPNVDGVVGLNHLRLRRGDQCAAAVVPIRTIHNIALNPNFGGEVMVIGLGCEKLQPERLLQGTEDVKVSRWTAPASSASRMKSMLVLNRWSMTFCRSPSATWRN